MILVSFGNRTHHFIRSVLRSALLLELQQSLQSYYNVVNKRFSHVLSLIKFVTNHSSFFATRNKHFFSSLFCSFFFDRSIRIESNIADLQDVRSRVIKENKSPRRDDYKLVNDDLAMQRQRLLHKSVPPQQHGGKREKKITREKNRETPGRIMTVKGS